MKLKHKKSQINTVTDYVIIQNGIILILYCFIYIILYPHTAGGLITKIFSNNHKNFSVQPL